jgi:hypothetical protein
MGQTPDQNASQQDATIRELKAELPKLESQVGNVTQTFQQQQETATLQEVTKFAEEPALRRTAEDIAFFMKSGRAKTFRKPTRWQSGSTPRQPKASADPQPQKPGDRPLGSNREGSEVHQWFANARFRPGGRQQAIHIHQGIAQAGYGPSG